MNKKIFLIGITLLTFSLSSCVLNSEFTHSGDYQKNTELSDLHLIVVGDKNTTDAMNYLGEFLTDSLLKSNIKTTKLYHCCRDKDTDMNSLIPKLLPNDYKPNSILTVVISKVVVGAGTESSREVQLDLFDAGLQKRTWTGRVKVNMSWFVSDKNYRDVARTLTSSIMEELKKKKIL